jgi:hypothetical protein
VPCFLAYDYHLFLIVLNFNMKRSLILLLSCLITVSVWSAPNAFTVKQDLTAEFKIYKDEQYLPYAGQDDIYTIYFFIDAEKFSGDYLHLITANKFAMFINGKLAAVNGTRFSIDSLSKTFGSSNLLVALHQRNVSTKSLQAKIETPTHLTTSVLTAEDKPLSFFRDFVVIASIFLLIMFIVVLNLNPKLASDYFSLRRIFNMREGDDNQIYMRITSSTNILFYIFCSLILGFYLMIVFHFISPAYTLSTYISSESFAGAVSQWMVLSLSILAIFFAKIILVYVTSTLFGSKELAGIHVFNWVRLLLIIFGSMSIVLFFYFILRGQSSVFHTILLNLIAWCLVGWIVIIFLKLRSRSGYSMFHLFSYICATEIIPLLIIITVLYN